MLPAQLAGARRGQAPTRADELFQKLGTNRYRDTYPGACRAGSVSGSPSARALVNSAALFLADEPTDAVDTATGEEIARLLLELNQ